MKFIAFIILLGFSFEISSQEVSAGEVQCDWYNKILESTDLSNRLEIAKKNFREYTSIDKNDPCRILYILSVNDRYYTLSRDSAVGFLFPDKMISEARLEDLDTIVALNKNTSKTLYGSHIHGVIVIQSSSINYEKRIDSIWSQKK